MAAALGVRLAAAFGAAALGVAALGAAALAVAGLGAAALGVAALGAVDLAGAGDLAGLAGATIQRPCSGAPRSAVKHEPESKRGRHIQSIEPSLPTSAQVRRSPINP